MKTFFTLAMTAILAAGLAAAPMGAQSRGSSSSASRSSSSQSTSRSSAAQTTSRSSAASTSRSSAASTSRSSASQSTTRSAAAQSTSRSSASQSSTRSSAAQSASRGSAASSSRSSASQSTTRSSAASSTRSSAAQSTSRSSAASTSRSSAAASTSRSSASQSTTRSSAGQSTSRSTAAQSTSRSTAASRSASDAPVVSRSVASNATRSGLSYESAGPTANRSHLNAPDDFMRIGEQRDVYRIPPRERDYLPYNRPGRFYGVDPHYYGYRVHHLPPRYRRYTYWGVDYYFYDGIYYRPWGNVYVVCRPPFGVTFEVSLLGATLRAVNFAYYCNSYRVYSAIDANNRIIDQQNLIIAQNNATIAAQNSAMALNTTHANTAYSLANSLGLVQSYAYANEPYYYQDGVFYRVNAAGQYEVIVPPAGALVGELPDDYETITLGGQEFYKVDDTVYRLTLVNGVPQLEVLGQMYGNLARQYNLYR
ncbi:MAG: hypothetical protein IJ616_01810 [Bacteroidales bacterium]|nr:hypothetical protein [Bacteroidales bacterium]